MIEAARKLDRSIDPCGPSESRVRLSGSGRTDKPLAGLAGSALSGRFRHWSGASGRRYLFSVYPLGCPHSLDGCPRYEDAVLLAVARQEDGTRAVLWAGVTGLHPDPVFDGAPLGNALAAGANEIHIHLLAPEKALRDAIVGDLGGGRTQT